MVLENSTVVCLGRRRLGRNELCIPRQFHSRFDPGTAQFAFVSYLPIEDCRTLEATCFDVARHCDVQCPIKIPFVESDLEQAAFYRLPVARQWDMS